MSTLEAAYKDLKVLVIDDQDTFRLTISVMLEHLGVSTVIEADSGATGYDELVRHKPDVVLCDMHMTPMDGQEFLRKARESSDPAIRDVAMIFLSGDNLLDTVRGAMRHRADGYLVKPFEVEDLKQQLDITVTILAERRKNKR
jgi:two-component system chemotaxis response regulator CheY